MKDRGESYRVELLNRLSHGLFLGLTNGLSFHFCPSHLPDVPSSSLILLQTLLLNYRGVSLVVSKDGFSSLSSSSLSSPWPQVEDYCTCLISLERTLLLFNRQHAAA